MLGIKEIIRWACDFVLVVLVQSFMLCQVGYFYARLRYTTKKTREPVPPPAEEILKGLISVIIPVFNEADTIERTLRRLDALAEDSSRLRVIICDSFCTDSTMDIVRRLEDDHSLKMPIRTAIADATCPGRGGAIRAGLKESTSNPSGLLLFIHADVVLPSHFDTMIRMRFAEPGTLMTAFEFCTDRERLPPGQGPPTGMAFMEFTVNLRSRYYELPFGDQGLATTQGILESVGGFPDFPILEEYELVQRLRRLSAQGAGRIVTLQSKCFCSPRRWLARPIWRVNMVNQIVMLWYKSGATPAEIYKYYYGHEPPLPAKQ